MIMIDNEKPAKKPINSNEALRDSIVQRLKAHDAAIRSTSLEKTPKSTTPKNQ